MFKNALIIFFLLSFFSYSYAELEVGFVKVDEILREGPQAAVSNKKLEGGFQCSTRHFEG